MGFSSFASYLDPSNWLQQQQSTGSSSNGDPQLSSTPLAPPPPPPPLPHQAVGGAGSVRPGSLADRARMANLMPEPALKCPRCESTSTKFCYFNNYSLSQPRHFCKTCRRYWTKGGALRNVPVGGGCRRNKRSKSGSKSMSNAAQKAGCSASTGTAPLPSNDTTGSSTADSLISLMPPPSRFLAPFHHLADYGGAAAEMGLSYGGILAASPGSTSEDIHMNIPLGSISNLLGGGGGGGSYLPAGGGDQWRLQQQQQQHAAAGIQNFPFMGSGGLANGMEPPAMGLYPLDGVEARGGSGGGFDLAGLVGVRQGKTSAVASSSSSSSSVLSQLASVKIEDSTKRDLNNLSSSSTSRQYLLGNINNQYWIDGAAGGSRGSGAAAWTDLSGFSSSSATGSNPL